MTHAICGALPEGGDGSVFCLCTATHRGPHVGHKNFIFKKAVSGTSWRARNRLKIKALKSASPSEEQE